MKLCNFKGAITMNKILDNVNDLEDFKSLPVKDLPRLASEIREFLIQNV